MKRSAFAAFLTGTMMLIAAMAAALADDEPNNFRVPDGTWVGVGYQLFETGPGFGAYETWEIRLTALAGAVTIAYPSLSCVALWQRERTSPLAVTFRETLSSGEDTCIDRGMVVVTPMEADRLRLEYYYPDDTLIAFAQLTRAK